MVGKALHSFMRRLARAMVARRMPGAIEVKAMSDHELRDLAIGRSEIGRLLEPCAAPKRLPEAWRDTRP